MLQTPRSAGKNAVWPVGQRLTPKDDNFPRAFYISAGKFYAIRPAKETIRLHEWRYGV
jgi:hypothetical protein